MGIFDSLFGKKEPAKLEILLRDMIAVGHVGSRALFEKKVMSEVRFGECLLYVPSRQFVPADFPKERLSEDIVFPENGFRIESEGKTYLVAFTSLEKLKKISGAEYHWAIQSKVLCDIVGRGTVKNLLLNPNCPEVFWLTFEGGVPADEELSKMEAEGIKEAEGGDPLVQLRLARNYQTGAFGFGRIDQVIKYLKLSAEQGNAEAQHALAACYLNREVEVADNFAEAFKWYRLSALSGRVEAQCSLGACYALGQGTPVNPVEACHWFRKAAEQGNATAQANLAVYLENGIGCSVDADEAYIWLKKSAAAGYATAQYNLGVRLLQEWTPGNSVAEAERLLNGAASQGMVPAMKALFHIYWSGNGAEADPTKAVHWIKRAAELGDASAQVLLGRIYLFEGEFAEIQPAKAKEWFVKAALSGNQDALSFAGQASQFGDGKTLSEDDMIDAMAWYEIAMDVDAEVSEKLEMVKSQCPHLVKAGRAKAVELRKLIREGTDRS